MDKFREWISDNLRYILLGLAVILILVVAVFAVKLISGLFGSSSTTKDTESNTPQAVIVETQSETDTPEENLVKDNPEVLTVVQTYYNALGSKDMETLEQVVETFDEDVKQKILERYEYIEGFNNISVYTKSGLEEGSWVTYVCHDDKVMDIETLVPGISSMYLKTGDDGSLFIADKEKDQAIKDYIEQTNSDNDVKALINNVTEKCAEAVASDPALKEFIDSYGTPETESVLPDSSDIGVQTNKIVEATDVCNVRTDSTEDAEVIGMLNIGETVTRVKELDNGWSEIRYGESTGYVKSDYLAEKNSSQ